MWIEGRTRGWLRRAVLLWSWSFVALNAQASSQEAARSLAWAPPAQFRLDMFTTEDGLPAHSVIGIDQTSDGRLWVATNGGLASFDGHVFTVYSTENTTMSSHRLSALSAVHPDSIWFAAEDGSLSILAHGRVHHIADVGGHVHDMSREVTGRTWMTRDDSVALSWMDGEIHREENTRVRMSGHRMWFNGRSGIRIDAAHSPRLWTDAAGRVWGVGFDPTEVGLLSSRGFLPQGRHDTSTLVVDRSNGRVLFATESGPLLTVRDITGEEVAVVPRVDDESQWWPRLLDRAGRLWASRGGQVTVFGPDGRIAVFDLGGQDVGAAFEDAEGNVWFGTSTEGLARIRPHSVQTLTREQGLEAESVRAIMDGPGESTTAWGSIDSQAIRGLRSFPSEGGLYLLTDHRGTEWWSRRSGRANLRGSGDGELVGYVDGAPRIFVDGHAPRELHLLTFDHDALVRVWLDGRSHEWRAELIRPYETPVRTEVLYEGSESTGIGGIRDVHQRAPGEVWISGNLGVARVRGEATDLFLADDGYPTEGARYFYSDAEGGLWLGTYGQGLLKLVGDDMYQLTADDGLAENVASVVLGDGDNLWIGGNRGIHRLSRSDAERRFAGSEEPVHVVSYGRPDGLPNPETTGGPGAKGKDGRLWFPTYGGAAVIDPGVAVAMDAYPVQAQVLGVAIEGVIVPEDSTDGASGIGNRRVSLAANQRRFEVAFSGVSLRDPESVRYSYLLEGFDPSWIDGGTSRTATYTNVGPGTYTFRVRAMNRAGEWGAREGTFTISVSPRLTETTTFRSALVLTLLLAIVGAYRVRIAGLRRREIGLQRRVRERTDDLVREKARTERAYLRVASQAAELQALSEARTRFFTNVSHEFRTPLTLIMAPLREVVARRYGELTPEVAAHVEGALARGEDLTRLVDRVLEASRLEAGELELSLEHRSIPAIVHRVADEFYHHAGRAGISFTVDAGSVNIVAEVDEERFEAVVRNLISNAFKFTPREGRIDVTLCRRGEGVELRVADTGIGISEVDLPQVFERFYQAEHESGDGRYGTGIGLALSREYVTLHGGTIEARSQLGQGATFTVWLPLPEEFEATPGEARGESERIRVSVPHDSDEGLKQQEGQTSYESVASDPDVPTVLIIEDHPDVRALIRSSLESEYRVLEARDGLEGIVMGREHHPDLVVSDVMMPGLGGMEVVQTIRDDPELSYIPTILLTAMATKDAVIAGIEHGADAYITKPFEPRELRARVRGLIESRRRLRDLWATDGRGDLPVVEIPLRSRNEPPRDREFLTRMYAVIAERLGEESFGVEDLAKALAMSRATLYRRVAETTDGSPLEAILGYRLEQAALWLVEIDASVSEIAYGVGFKSVPHFSTRFKARFGETPSRYRAARRG